jgi:hypothetical protein
MARSNRKNIQVIDGALNCTYGIFSLPEGDFRLVFPVSDQDVEFIEDFFARDDAAAQRVWASMWKSPVDKKLAHGIHGTVFCGLQAKRRFYPSKREKDMITGLE